MAKFLSEEYFKELESGLNSDQKWLEGTKNLKTSILLTSTDQNSSFFVGVEGGRTTIKKVEPSTQAEFTFEGPYEVWTKLGKGEIDFQTAVLKGSLRFRGSITKILFYKDRFLRMADVIKDVPKEF